MSLNQILLIGNCGSDPEMRYTPNGSMVVNFSLAVNSYRNGSDGEQIQETEWFRVSCWNKTAESVNQFLQKDQDVLLKVDLDQVHIPQMMELKDNLMKLQHLELFS